MIIPMQYVREFPLIPGGGLFFLPVGICVALGAFLPRLRMALVWAGMLLGIVSVALGWSLYRGLPPPSRLQVACFGAAIFAETLAFRFVIPRVRPMGERALWICTLAIVGAHFLIMIPAFGAPIAVLALLCLGNATAAFVLPAYPAPAMWFVDGVFKTGVGAVMLAASPLFA
ncbi:MAG TPA: DUF6609 family protein [Rhizomicrobium sp.]|nr:DUF6609 family protein [Rhizomicrobium sp.]